MFLKNNNRIKLLREEGNAILIGIISVTILGVTIVLLTNGYFSTLKFKSRVEQKASLSEVENGILLALTKASFYEPTQGSGSSAVITASQFINGILGGSGLDVSGAGTLISFSNSEAIKLDKNLKSKTFRERCNTSSLVPKVPASRTAPADFVFCISMKNNGGAKNTFFGSDAAFALIKVSLKKTSQSQREFIVGAPNWGGFVDDLQRVNNYQADIFYSIFWGEKDKEINIFEKSGNALKDLR